MKNILFLTNIPAPYTVDFFNEIAKNNKLTVIFDCESETQRNKEWLCKKSNGYKTILFNNKKIGDLKKLFLYLKVKDTYIIIGNYYSFIGICSILYMKKNKIKFFIHADGGEIKKENTIKRYLKKFLISSANWYLSPGNITDEYFKFYGGNDIKILRYPFSSVRKKDTLKTPMSIELKRKERNDIGLFNEEKVGIFLGRIVYGKGLDILIKSASLINKNIGIHVFGGYATQELINIMKRMNVQNIVFHGFKKPDELINIIKYADFMVFPTRSDVWGLVVNEALSQGIPVITTDKCIAGRELIENGRNGYIVHNEDYQEIAQKINQICSNNKTLYEMSKKCLEINERYTIENMVVEYLKQLERCKL